MKIIFTASFEKDFKKLNKPEKEQVCDVLSKLPNVMGKTHSHSGAGMRKIHSSGIFETRLGLGLRLIFALKTNALILHRLGGHDVIRKYLRNL